MEDVDRLLQSSSTHLQAMEQQQQVGGMKCLPQPPFIHHQAKEQQKVEDVKRLLWSSSTHLLAKEQQQVEGVERLLGSSSTHLQIKEQQQPSTDHNGRGKGEGDPKGFRSILNIKLVRFHVKKF